MLWPPFAVERMLIAPSLACAVGTVDGASSANEKVPAAISASATPEAWRREIVLFMVMAVETVEFIFTCEPPLPTRRRS